MITASLLLLGLALGQVEAQTQASSALQPERYREAIIVGFNRSPRPALPPLRFADDDAVRLSLLLGQTDDRVTLLAELDDETALLFPAVSPQAPSRQAVLGAIADSRERLEAARQRGQQPALLFAYSGHGDVDREGRGLVYLSDGGLTQRDLAAALGEVAEQVELTVMVDACNAALLVSARGGGYYGDRVPAAASEPGLKGLERAGLILSTSGRAEVHEWERLLSGVFSYEVRSGLLGAADLDDDRRITYAELDAFVAAANARIHNPVARLSPTIRGPSGRGDTVVIDLNRAHQATFLRVDEQVQGHAALHDASWLRQADFNKEAAQRFWLMLMGSTPLALVVDGRERPVEVQGVQVAALGPAHSAATTASRGLLDDYFERHLFEQPFGTTFAEQHAEAPTPPPEAVALSPWEIARLVLAPYILPATISGAVILVGGASYGGAWIAHGAAVDAHWADDTATFNSLASGLGIGGLVTAGVGGLALLSTATVLGIEIASWQFE
ncbi:MAG: hypothetical protein ABIJ09_23940 [Pseudomonadota bacterium]